MRFAHVRDAGQIQAFPSPRHPGRHRKEHSHSREWLDKSLIAETSTDIPLGYEIDCTQPPYSPLIRTGETNRSSGLPYVMGLRDTVWLQLRGNALVEVKRDEPGEEEVRQAKELANESD